ncbi:MAG: thiamine diphosphokinase [Erysipelotrichales bacterium]
MKRLNIIASVPHENTYYEGFNVGVDRGAQYLLEKDLQIDLAIGDFDSIDQDKLVPLLNKALKVEKLDAHKDVTDLEAALSYLDLSSFNQVNVYGAIGGRLDHTLTNLNLLKKYPSILLFDDYSVTFIIKAGEYRIDKGLYKYISFYAMEDTYISLREFKYPLENYHLKLDDTLCVSNEIEGNAWIKVDKDVIVVQSK